MKVSLTSAAWGTQRHQNDSRWLQGYHCQKGSDLSMGKSYRDLDVSFVPGKMV